MSSSSRCRSGWSASASRSAPAPPSSRTARCDPRVPPPAGVRRRCRRRAAHRPRAGCAAAPRLQECSTVSPGARRPIWPTGCATSCRRRPGPGTCPSPPSAWPTAVSCSPATSRTQRLPPTSSGRCVPWRASSRSRTSCWWRDRRRRLSVEPPVRPLLTRALVGAALLAPVAGLGGYLALSGGGGGDDLLPISLASGFTGITYEAGADLPELEGEAPAYELDRPDAGDVRELADALGLGDDVEVREIDGQEMVVQTDTGTLSVALFDTSGSWNYSSFGSPTPGDGDAAAAQELVEAAMAVAGYEGDERSLSTAPGGRRRSWPRSSTASPSPACNGRPPSDPTASSSGRAASSVAPIASTPSRWCRPARPSSG